MAGALLSRRPLTTAVLYSVVGSFPLFFAGGYAIRLQHDLGISRSQFGLAVSAYFVTSAISSFTIGRLVDRRGARVGFVAAGLGGSLASLAVALAGSFWSLAAALGVAGLANTAGQLAANRILAGLGVERQGAGFGIKQAAVPFGSFCAGAIIGLVGRDIEWRAAFGIYAVVALATVAVAPNGSAPQAGSDGRTATATGDHRRPVGDDWPFLLALAAAGGFGGATGNALALLTVDAFGVAGYDEAVGATALAVGSAIAIVGRSAIGWLAGWRRASGFVELGAAMALGAVGFSLLAVAGSSRLLLWVGVLIGFLAAWGWPGVMYYTVIRNTSTTPATASGVVVAGVFLGGIAGAPLLAAIAERWSYGSAWATAAIMTTVAAGLVVVAARLAPKRAAGPVAASND